MTLTAVASEETFHPAAGVRPAPGAPLDAPPVLVSDSATAGRLDRREGAALLAEVVAHRAVETPMAIGILGPSGSGKSRFMRAVVDAAQDLGTAAAALGGQGPFLGRIVTVHVEAAPGRDPAALFAGAVIAAVADDHAGFVEDAIHAGGDPREAARLAGERVNALRLSLDAERQTLDTLGDRRARLTDTVLFDAAGSRVDSFARANRARIEARFRAFGLAAGDPVRIFKEWVRDNAEASGGGQVGLALRALWAFKGQGLLLALALLLAILGWATGVGADDPDRTSNWFGGFGDRFSGLADYGRAHLDLLQPLSRIAWALAALALLADVVRAARFLGPILKGITLLRGDLDARRRDLDGLLAHQTRRVDTLAAEAESAGRSAETAQRRAEGRAGTALSDGGAALAAQRFGLARSTDAAAERFFAELGVGMAAGDAAPQRIVVALDGLERLPAPDAAAVLAAAHRMFGRPGFVMVVALDREQATAALGEFDPALAASRLDRVLQLTYDLGGLPLDAATLATRLLDPRPRDSAPRSPADAARSVLDHPFQPIETDLVKALASFAGATPRAVKRFVNSYRVARADSRLGHDAAPATLGMVALSLALDGTGAGSELQAFDRDLAGGRVTVAQDSEFGRAFAKVLSVVGKDVDGEDLRRGLAVARTYGRRG